MKLNLQVLQLMVHKCLYVIIKILKLTYTFHGTPLGEPSHHRFIGASACDVSDRHLFIVDKYYVFIFNLRRELLSSFALPQSEGLERGIKVDNGNIYLTIRKQHQVFVYDEEGNLSYTIGNIVPSAKRGEFNQPAGLTVDATSLYVCDSGNHYIQILSKNYNHTYYSKHSGVYGWGRYGTKDGEFNFPYSICISDDENCYVGDYVSVQLFNKSGVFLQRLGQDHIGWDEGIFNHVFSICVIDDLIYVSDYNNFRIQIFKHKTSPIQRNNMEQELVTILIPE